MQPQEIEIRLGKPVPGVLKAIAYALIVVGLLQVTPNLLNIGGYVLALIFLTLYVLLERAAIEYHNNYQVLKTIMEIKMLEIYGTNQENDGLTIHEEDSNETSTE